MPFFSQEHADAACNFFEVLLKHTADDWYGKPFLLAPWQEEALSQIFGPRDDDGGQLIQRMAHGLVAVTQDQKALFVIRRIDALGGRQRSGQVGCVRIGGT